MFCGCQNIGRLVVLLGHGNFQRQQSLLLFLQESAKLIFQGFSQLHFVGNQFPQWDVIHCDWAAKTVFITLPCPFFICIPHITRSVKVWCLNQMRAWTSWLGLRCKNSVYTHLHYLKNPQFWLGSLVDHPFQNRKVMTVSFQVQSRFKPSPRLSCILQI